MQIQILIYYLLTHFLYSINYENQNIDFTGTCATGTYQSPINIDDTNLLCNKNLFVDDRKAWEALGNMSQTEAMENFCILLEECSPELKPWMEAQHREVEEMKRKKSDGNI